MDSSESLPTLSEPPGPSGELVVQHGRHSGTRRPLAVPMTLIGQTAGCDVRLTADGVGPLHCVILDDPHGPVLRDLGSLTGTRVNGQPIGTHRLNNGDVIDIGPFQFSIALSAPRTAEIHGAVLQLEGQYEALRIQAAAVAAQQSALLEEEGRLQQRGTALERQETQLANHLAQRQRQLDEAEEQLRQERTAFKDECAARQSVLEGQRSDLAAALAAAEQERQKADKERRRLVELRRRLKKRWHRHWDAQEASLKKREQAVQHMRQLLENERGKVVAFQERTNGELELGRRLLRDEWQQLGLAQQQWDEILNQEMSERRRHEKALESRQASVESAEKTLAGKERRWQQQHAGLIKEEQGLEARIRNQRATLEALQRDVAQHQGGLDMVSRTPAATLSAPVLSVLPSETVPADLRELTGTLNDQRLHLTEQWQKLLQVQESWHEEREAALAELEATARRLAQRDGEVRASERVLESARDEIERRREGLSRLRESLEGWQTRLTIQETDGRSQREALVEELASRERLLQTRTRQLEEVHQRRNRRRQHEVVEFQAARARCDEARRQYSALWQECERLRETLGQQERSLSSRALALERYRQETVAQAPDSARAESRLDRLCQRDAARQEAEVRDLIAEQHKLQQQRKRLDEQATRLGGLEEELLRRHREYAARVSEWESQRAVAEEEDRRREQEVRRLRALHALSEGQLRQLRDELERIARVMIDEAEEPRVQQAA
jgi:hypothetical protein